MVIGNIARNQQRIADNLNPADSVTPIIKQHVELVVCVEGPTKIEENQIGNSWIVGSSTNGLVGTNTATQGGGQQVVGGDGRVDTLVNVSNPNDLYQEFLSFSTYVDVSETSAVVSTTNQDITF